MRIQDGTYETSVEDKADDDLPAPAAWWQSVLRGSRVDTLAARSPALRVVDAFCGSGGLALGLKFAAEASGRDADFMAIIDTDSAALEVHRHNLGGRRQIAQSAASLVDFHVLGSGPDVRFGYEPEVISSELARIGRTDMFVAGPPCEGHSNLNNYTRRQDPRNDLYLTAAALGVALRANMIVLENVPTVKNAYSGVVETAIGLLRSSGYGVSSAILRADELGAAQRRTRFFILAIKGVDLDDSYLESVAETLRAPAMPLSWAISDLLDREPVGIMDTPPTLTAANMARVEYLFSEDLYDLPDTQRPECHRNGTSYTAVYGRMFWDKPTQTITTGFGTPGQGRFIHPLRRRLITPREAARIQGYPDWFDFMPETVPATRKNLAKWIGDAVHPILGYAVGLAALNAFAPASLSPPK